MGVGNEEVIKMHEKRMLKITKSYWQLVGREKKWKGGYHEFGLRKPNCNYLIYFILQSIAMQGSDSTSLDLCD